jgi:hypothetical protein
MRVRYVIVGAAVAGINLLDFQNHGAAGACWMHSQLCGADLNHVSGCDAPCTDLPAPVDDYCLAAQGRDPQTAQRTRHQYGVTVLDSRRGKLQVLAGGASDRETTCMNEHPTSLGGAFWRTADGGLAY